MNNLNMTNLNLYVTNGLKQTFERLIVIMFVSISLNMWFEYP